MGTRMENFLGRELVLPDDRLYDPAEGLWVKKESDGSCSIGLSEPAVLMAGTIREIEMLAENGSHVTAGDTVALALTAKLKYMATPLSGTLTYPAHTGNLPEEIAKDPYSAALYRIVPESGATEGLVDAGGYADGLRDSEGARNPGGHSGGVSPTCKAVYMGLRGQNLRT